MIYQIGNELPATTVSTHLAYNYASVIPKMDDTHDDNGLDEEEDWQGFADVDELAKCSNIFEAASDGSQHDLANKT